MKLKIVISGPKVHDICYWVFLLKNSMNTALTGLSVYNWEEGEMQQVVALAEGERDRVEAFLKAIRTNKPELAEVSGVTSEPYEGEVGRISEVAMLCSFVQLDKAIPLLLDMRDDLKAVRKNTDMIPQMSEDVRAVRKNIDMIPQMSEDLKAVRITTDAVRKTTDATLEEIKGMREAIQPGYATNFRQMQSDIRAIKERQGMP